MEYSFQPNLQIIQPTEIYVPGLVYDQGFTVQTSDNLNWEQAEDSPFKILVYAHTEDVATIRIDPK